MNTEYSTREDFASISLRDLADAVIPPKAGVDHCFPFRSSPPLLCSACCDCMAMSRIWRFWLAVNVLDPLVTTEATNQMVPMTPALTDEEVNSEAELLKSRDVLEQVVLANGMQKAHGRSFLDFFRPRTEADRVARAVQMLASKIKVETPPKTNLIEVTYSSSDPTLAYGVLNSLGNLYLEKHAAVHRPPGSYQFFAAGGAALQGGSGGLRSTFARIWTDAAGS